MSRKDNKKVASCKAEEVDLCCLLIRRLRVTASVNNVDK